MTQFSVKAVDCSACCCRYRRLDMAEELVPEGRKQAFEGGELVTVVVLYSC